MVHTGRFSGPILHLSNLNFRVRGRQVNYRIRGAALTGCRIYEYGLLCRCTTVPGVSYRASYLSVLNDLVELFPNTTIMNCLSVRVCVDLGYTGTYMFDQ